MIEPKSMLDRISVTVSKPRLGHPEIRQLLHNFSSVSDSTTLGEAIRLTVSQCITYSQLVNLIAISSEYSKKYHHNPLDVPFVANMYPKNYRDRLRRYAHPDDTIHFVSYAWCWSNVNQCDLMSFMIEQSTFSDYHLCVTLQRTPLIPSVIRVVFDNVKNSIIAKVLSMKKNQLDPINAVCLMTELYGTSLDVPGTISRIVSAVDRRGIIAITTSLCRVCLDGIRSNTVSLIEAIMLLALRQKGDATINTAISDVLRTILLYRCVPLINLFFKCANAIVSLGYQQWKQHLYTSPEVRAMFYEEFLPIYDRVCLSYLDSINSGDTTCHDNTIGDITQRQPKELT